MNVPSQGRAGRARLVVLVAALLAMLAVAVGAQAAVNGFDGGDGDQDANCTATIDWRCLDAAQMVTVADGSGSNDDAFGSGSKENEPNGWSLINSGTSNKADVLAAWSSVGVDASHRTYLDLAFQRASGSGDTFLGFELNQVRETFVNPKGTEVPCRTDGDVLVSYDARGSGASMDLYEWQGSSGPASCPDGGKGSFTGPVSLPDGAEIAMNSSAAIANFLSPDVFGASFAKATFGEAALDLTGLADAIGFTGRACEYFERISINTRSAGSTSASLQDRVSGLDVTARACETPGDGIVAPPVITSPLDGAHFDVGPVTVTGTAPVGTTVTLYDGAVAVAFADVDAGGNWTTTLALADGQHVFTAEATDDASGVTSAKSNTVTVTIGRRAPTTGLAPPPAPPAPPPPPAPPAAPAPAPVSTKSTAPLPTPAAAVSPLTIDLGGKPCAVKSFRAYVTMPGIRYVRFRVDGELIRTVRKADAHGQFVARIDATRFTGGRHRLAARVVFKNGRRKSRVVSLPFRRCGHKCASRRSFRIRIPVPAGDQLASATVYVNGKRTKVIRGHRLTARVTLIGLRKGIYTVRIRARTRSGRTITTTRRYRTCTLKPATRR